MKLDNLVFGKTVVKHLLQHYPHLVQQLFFPNNSVFLSLVKKQNISYQIWSSSDFQKHFPQQNHQFIAALINHYSYYSWKQLLLDLKNNNNQNYLILILDHLQDTHNFGSILRTASATKVDAVIIPNFNQAPVNASTIKAAAGNVFDLKIVQVANLVQVIVKLKTSGFWIFSTTSTGSTFYDQPDFVNLNTALVIGNESQGVSNLLQQKSDFLLKIPMLNTESLNVSNATAILLYQIRKQQNFWKINQK